MSCKYEICSGQHLACSHIKATRVTLPETQDFGNSALVVLLADVRDLAEYATHDSWRCKYGECKCGLDALTDKIGLERIPCE